MEWIHDVFKKMKLQENSSNEKTGEVFTLIIGGTFYSRNRGKDFVNDVKIINKVARELAKICKVQKKQIDKNRYTAYSGR